MTSTPLANAVGYAAAVPAKPDASEPPRTRLSREKIVLAAMALVEDGDELSFRRLGVALEINPTSIYRHFRTKDDLTRAIVDRVAQESMGDWEASGDWRADLRDIALRMHAFYGARPRLAKITAVRTARGEHEFAAVEAVLTALRSAGLRGESLARGYRSVTTFWMAYMVGDSIRASLDEETREADRVAWLFDYQRVDPERFPTVSEIAPLIPLPDDPSTFAFGVELMLGGIAELARREGT